MTLQLASRNIRFTIAVVFVAMLCVYIFASLTKDSPSSGRGVISESIRHLSRERAKIIVTGFITGYLVGNVPAKLWLLIQRRFYNRNIVPLAVSTLN